MPLSFGIQSVFTPSNTKSLPGYYAVSLSDLIIERGGTYISDFSQVTFGIP